MPEYHQGDVRELTHRVEKTELEIANVKGSQQAHEDICGMRYQAFIDKLGEVKKEFSTFKTSFNNRMMAIGGLLIMGLLSSVIGLIIYIWTTK